MVAFGIRKETEMEKRYEIKQETHGTDSVLWDKETKSKEREGQGDEDFWMTILGFILSSIPQLYPKASSYFPQQSPSPSHE